MRKLLLASAATMGALLITAGGAYAQPVKQVAPGTIAVHLNGYLQFAIGDFGSTDNTVAGNKLNPIVTNGDARIYAGFDAQSLSGIDYGAQIELRTATSNPSGTVGSSVASTGANASAMYVRRAYGYIGTEQAGFIRLGQTDGSFGLLQSGVLEGFGDGQQFNADGTILTALPVQPSLFVYADTSHLYATDKIVYLSPKIAGFSAGFDYEPSSTALKQGTADCTASFSTTATPATTALEYCSALSATTGSVSASERKNTIAGAVMYDGNFAGFATKASVGILNAAPIAENGATPDPYTKDMTVYQAGAQTSYAGFTVGANVKWGSLNNGYAFVPDGGRDGVAYIVNGTYVVGPYVLGASFFNQQSAGSWTATNGDARTETQYGFATGANYVVGKDLSLFAQYMYAHLHQPTHTSTGNLQMQLVETGATFKW